MVMMNQKKELLEIDMDRVNDLRRQKKWSWQDLADESCLSMDTLRYAAIHWVRPFVAEFLSTGLGVPKEQLIKKIHE